MEKKDRIDALGATVLLVFNGLLGLNQVLVKLVNAGMSPVFQSGLRSACAFVCVLAYAHFARKRMSISDGSLVPGLITGALFGVEFILLFVALDYTTVARASVLFYTMPFWLAIAAHFLIPGERLTPLRIVGLVLAISGVAWALLNNDKEAGPEAFLGDLACIAASMMWAAIAMLIRTTDLGKSSPEMTLLYQLAVSAVIALPVAFYIGDEIREPTLAIWGIFAFQVIVIVSIGFAVWFWVLSIYPASDMASFSFLAPMFGVLSGWLVLGEELTFTIIYALAMVCIGIVLINWKPRKNQAAQTL